MAENKCINQCPSECIETIFQLNGRMDPVMNFGYNWPFIDDPDTHTIVLIKISPIPFVKTVHKPRVLMEELMGTVGGHLGIWLGFSLYSLIKFCVHFAFASFGKCFRFSFTPI